MAWGSIRQHSTGATWEHRSPTKVKPDRFLGFLPSFRLGKASSKRILRARGATSSSTNRDGSQKPSFQVLHRRARQPTTRPPPTATQQQQPRVRSIYKDDPAFSADPRSHPLFRHDQTRSPSSIRRPLSGSYSRRRRSGVRARRPTTEKHRREPVIYNRTDEDSLSDPEMEGSAYGLLVRPKGHPDHGQGKPFPGPPQSSSHSSESANTNSTIPSVSIAIHTTPPSATSTPPSSNDHSTSPAYLSVPVKHSPSGPVNRAPSPMDDLGGATASLQPNPPPTYEESIFSPESDPSLQKRPPTTAPSTSEPPLQPFTQPPRPSTATPAHDADTRPQRREATTAAGGSAARQTAQAQRARELDRIDELDETDPFGGGVHHRGPYEAINAILGGGGSSAYGSAYGSQAVKASRSKKQHTQQVQFPETQTHAAAAEVDLYAPLHLEPGQILQRIPAIFDPRNLEQTPYQRQHHHSYSNPGPAYQQAMGQGQGTRRHSERLPPHPRHLLPPQQQQQTVIAPPVEQHHHHRDRNQTQSMPTQQVDQYPQPPSMTTTAQLQHQYHRPHSEQNNYQPRDYRDDHPQPHESQSRQRRHSEAQQQLGYSHSHAYDYPQDAQPRQRGHLEAQQQPGYSDSQAYDYPRPLEAQPRQRRQPGYSDSQAYDYPRPQEAQPRQRRHPAVEQQAGYSHSQASDYPQPQQAQPRQRRHPEAQQQTGYSHPQAYYPQPEEAQPQTGYSHSQAYNYSQPHEQQRKLSSSNGPMQHEPQPHPRQYDQPNYAQPLPGDIPHPHSQQQEQQPQPRQHLQQSYTQPLVGGISRASSQQQRTPPSSNGSMQQEPPHHTQHDRQDYGDQLLPAHTPRPSPQQQEQRPPPSPNAQMQSQPQGQPHHSQHDYIQSGVGNTRTPPQQEQRPPPSPNSQMQHQHPQPNYLQLPHQNHPQPLQDLRGRPRPQSAIQEPSQPPPLARSRTESSHYHRDPHPPPPNSNLYPPDHHRAPSHTSSSSHYASSSRYDSSRGPTPLHVPKRLVMPSPLHQPAAPLPPRSRSYTLEPQQQQYQQQEYPYLRPTPSQVQFRDPAFSPPSAIPSRPSRAEDISMLPDGRKLIRKKTVSATSVSKQPIPFDVPITEVSLTLPTRAATVPAKSRYIPRGQETKGREKTGKRLSKRRNDV